MKAKEEDLTDEYKKERDQLLQTIHRNLKPKEKNGRKRLLIQQDCDIYACTQNSAFVVVHLTYE